MKQDPIVEGLQTLMEKENISDVTDIKHAANAILTTFKGREVRMERDATGDYIIEPVDLKPLDVIAKLADLGFTQSTDDGWRFDSPRLDDYNRKGYSIKIEPSTLQHTFRAQRWRLILKRRR